MFKCYFLWFQHDYCWLLGVLIPSDLIGSYCWKRVIVLWHLIMLSGVVIISHSFFHIAVAVEGDQWGLADAWWARLFGFVRFPRMFFLLQSEYFDMLHENWNRSFFGHLFARTKVEWFLQRSVPEPLCCDLFYPHSHNCGFGSSNWNI